MRNATTSTPSVAEQRAHFARAHAPRLAALASGLAQTPPGDQVLKRSKVASFFDHPDHLVVVAGPHSRVPKTGVQSPKIDQDRDADHAVAYGLAYAGDRKLVAVLPDDASHPTLTRAPWLKDMEVWTYDLAAASKTGGYSSLRQYPAPPREQILKMYGGPAYGFARHLDDDHLDGYLKGRARWVDRLIRWAEDDPDLQAAHRQSYLAWHCQGRMVLKIASTKRGLKVSAGVHRSGGPKPRQTDPPLTELIKPAESHRLIAAASDAAADRLDGTDSANQEHRLQAALADGLQPLGISHPRREYPAFRPTNDPEHPARSYIDFLGSDDSGRMHVLETKIGNDPMLVLQGLDYWIWATANATRLQDSFDLSQAPEVVVDFVTAAPTSGGAAIGPYTLKQAKRLAGEVKLSFWEVHDWQTGQPRLELQPSQA